MSQHSGFGFRDQAVGSIHFHTPQSGAHTVVIICAIAFLAISGVVANSGDSGYWIWLLCAGFFVWGWAKRRIIGYDMLAHNCRGSVELARNSEKDPPWKVLAVEVVRRGGKSHCELCPEKGRVYLRLPLGGIFRKLGEFTESKMPFWRFRFLTAGGSRVRVLAVGAYKEASTGIEMGVAEVFAHLEDPTSIFATSQGPDDYINVLASRAEKNDEAQTAAKTAVKEACALEARLSLTLLLIKELIDKLKVEKNKRPSAMQQATRERLQEIYVEQADERDPLKDEFRGELLAVERARREAAQSAQPSS